jgi:hypothetical protein
MRHISVTFVGVLGVGVGYKGYFGGGVVVGVGGGGVP